MSVLVLKTAKISLLKMESLTLRTDRLHSIRNQLDPSRSKAGPASAGARMLEGLRSDQATWKH